MLIKSHIHKSEVNINRLIAVNLLVYSSAHAIVDAACAGLIFSGILTGKLEMKYLSFLILLYNFLAFGMQVPFGYIVDRLKISRVSAITGCMLIALAVFFKLSIITVFLIGTGNALFHIGGGITVLRLEPGKASGAGIYVAPGALGLMIGTLVGKNGHFLSLPFAALMLISSLCILFTEAPQSDGRPPGKLDYSKIEVFMLLLLSSVVIRGIIGLALDFTWKANIYLLVILTLGISFGKAVGGILADRFGLNRVAFWSLLLAAPMLSFGQNYPIIAITGVFLFNMTMPITLAAVVNVIPDKPGFAFGLTTLALMVGVYIKFAGLISFFSYTPIVLVTILLSSFILYKGLKLYYK